jgi:hypothetical protein
MANLFIIFLQYTSEHFAGSLAHLKLLEKRCCKKGTKATIIVDNQIPTGQTIKNDQVTIYGGDNTFHEFSGWQIGIDILEHQYTPEDIDVILIANDTFFRNYDPSWLDLFKKKHFRLASKKHVMIGWMDVFPEPMKFLNFTSKDWIRTNCFIVNYGLLKNLLPLPISQTPDKIFSHSVSSFFNDSSHLSAKYKAYLRSWLFDEKSPLIDFKPKWYRSTSLNQENLEYFEKKAFSIICEHALSARAKSLGGSLVAINKVNSAGKKKRKKSLMVAVIRSLIRRLKNLKAVSRAKH